MTNPPEGTACGHFGIKVFQALVSWSVRDYGHAQDNVLYTIQESDSHALFMELSRLLFDGTPDLHLANFLHMITTMAE
ncbi:hypothetical protein CFP56_031060 [Quercus suber]|uniref:Uncharacterized protein n=1 Tax=Quercus suber TaxID=58331 RepID=A0AAW0LUL0_QUESU